MSRWLTRSRAEAFAFGAWALAVAAAALLVDSTVAFVTILSTGLCAAIVYQSVLRRWWAASRMLAVGAVLLVNSMTAGGHSQTRHNVAFAVSLAAMAYFVIAGDAEKKAAARRAARTASELSDDKP